MILGKGLHLKSISSLAAKQINSLVLAYIGDCIYENYIRHFLVSKGIGNVNSLQREAIKYVSAIAQSNVVHKMVNNKFLTDEEVEIFNRIRNSKNHSHPKSCDIITYKCATGLEGLIGYLDLIGNHKRVEEIMNYIVGD